MHEAAKTLSAGHIFARQPRLNAATACAGKLLGIDQSFATAMQNRSSVSAYSPTGSCNGLQKISSDSELTLARCSTAWLWLLLQEA